MYFVMTDIHGCYHEFTKMLNLWNRDTEKLIILGDLIDRGPDSKLVVQELIKLKEIYSDKVIILSGNHDRNFITWILGTQPNELAHYYSEMFQPTIQSFYDFHASEADKIKYRKGTIRQRAEHILYHYKKELRFLRDLPYYHETEDIIFVHAGINLNIPDWRTDTLAMTDIRNPFIYSKKIAPKRVFFGHTPTALMSSDRVGNFDHSIWVSPNKDKIGLDGACAMGGQLNAVRVSKKGIILDTLIVPSMTII